MIEKIYITRKSQKYLDDRWLKKQFEKTKEYILDWNLQAVNFKLREPKKEKIYYFKINRQFRAWCVLGNNTLKIFHIDNHQN